MIRYLLLFLFSIFASQSWHALAAIPTNIYNYDASLSYSNDRNTGYEGQNSNYDDTSNFRYCCNEESISDFQEKNLGGSFFAFIDSFIVTKKGLGGNPFKGKTPKHIDYAFRKKGFDVKGTDPVVGKGSYINPKTGRKYYIDKSGKYKKGTELPHVDVHRLSSTSYPRKNFLWAIG